MEGIAGDHAALDAAVARFTREELAKIEAEIKKPSFRRAQVGFNNNMKFRDQVFHVQTEDSGLDKPHLITHLFADGGRVIKSHKRSYASEVARPDVSPYVRQLMKAQHMEMVLMLREGKFDDILAGKRIGGMELLTEPPNADVRKLSRGKKDTAADLSERRRAGEARSLQGGRARRRLRSRRCSVAAAPRMVMAAPRGHLLWKRPSGSSCSSCARSGAHRRCSRHAGMTR